MKKISVLMSAMLFVFLTACGEAKVPFDAVPGNPTNLTAVLNPDKSITLTWTAAANVSNGYSIARAALFAPNDSIGAWFSIGNTAASIVTFKDSSSIQAGLKYRYRVQGNNGTKQSDGATFDIVVP